MRSKVYEMKNDLVLIELTDNIKKRLIVTHPDYDLSYELMSVLNENNKKFDMKEYISNLEEEKLIDYLQEINDDADDYLYHDDIDINPLIDEGGD